MITLWVNSRIIKMVIRLRNSQETCTLLKGFVTAGRIYGRPEEAYLLAAVVYFIICYALSSWVRRLQAKVAIVR